MEETELSRVDISYVKKSRFFCGCVPETVVLLLPAGLRDAPSYLLARDYDRGVSTPSFDEPRTGRRRSSEVRADLVEAAGKHFAARPYAEVTTKDIAESAGVSMSVMYRHFPAKTDLFREVTLVPLIGAIEEFADSWRSQRNEPWTSYRLAHAFLRDLYLNLIDHRDSLIALVSADGLDIDLVEELVTAIDRLFDQVLLIGVYESERVGWYDREGLDLAVRQIAAMVFGTIAFDRWLFPPGTTKDQTKFLDSLTQLAVWGLSRRPPDGYDDSALAPPT
jgi:AcrR family transcriptional regulator